MSYHGPRDNGEGRTGPEHDIPSTPDSSNRVEAPIPPSLRTAWGLNNRSSSPENEIPEVTNPSPTPSIIQLLRNTPRPRSRSPTPNIRQASARGGDRGLHVTTSGTRTRAIFRPGTFGLTPPIIQATMSIESAIIAALDVTPQHLIRAHVNIMLSHHCPLPTPSTIDDPIEDLWYLWTTTDLPEKDFFLFFLSCFLHFFTVCHFILLQVTCPILLDPLLL